MIFNCDNVCRSLNTKPNSIYDAEGTSLKSYQKVAKLMIEFIDSANDSILDMNLQDQEKVRKSLEKLKEEQLFVHRSLKACFLANIAFEDFVEMNATNQVKDNDIHRKLYAANKVLNQPVVEAPFGNLKGLFDYINDRIISEDYKASVKPLEDVEGDICVFQSKIYLLIEAIKAKALTSKVVNEEDHKATFYGWRLCTIL